MDNNNRNYRKPKVINRIATPIKLDANGNRIEEQEVVKTSVVTNEPIIVKQEVKDNVVEKEHDPSTAIFLVVMLILVAILVAFLVYYALPKYFERKNLDKYNRNPSDGTNRITSTSHDFVIDNIKITENNSINYNGVFTITDGINISYTDGKISVNDNYVVDAEELLNTVGFVDDVVIFGVQNSGDRTTRLMGVTKTGEVILDLYNLIESDGGMVIGHDSSSIVFNRTSIVLLSSKLANSTNLITSNGEGLYDGYDICDEQLLLNNRISSQFIVAGNYTISYIGNHKFSTPVSIYSITLSVYKKTNNLCN